jgi:hypothetical protein
MRLYGRPVRYYVRDPAGGEISGQYYSASLTTTETPPDAADYSYEQDSFPDQEPGDDNSYPARKWDAVDESLSGYSQLTDNANLNENHWAENSNLLTEWEDNSFGQLDNVQPDLRWPDYRQQVLVSRPDVSYHLFPYWTSERTDQSLVWLTFLIVFLVVFLLALLLGWSLQLAAKVLRKRSQV